MGAVNQKLRPGICESSGPDLRLLDGAQVSDQSWAKWCVYFAILPVLPDNVTEQHQGLQDCRIKALSNGGCYKEGNL